MKQLPKEWWDETEFICIDTHELVKGYKSYLKTKHWTQKRISIFRRDNHKCQECGKTMDLRDANVHHLTYDHVGNELNEDLILLCPDCHKKIHGIQKRTRTKKNWKEKSWKK